MVELEKCKPLEDSLAEVHNTLKIIGAGFSEQV
jgi:hypothetical protein